MRGLGPTHLCFSALRGSCASSSRPALAAEVLLVPLTDFRPHVQQEFLMGEHQNFEKILLWSTKSHIVHRPASGRPALPFHPRDVRCGWFGNEHTAGPAPTSLSPFSSTAPPQQPHPCTSRGGKERPAACRELKKYLSRFQ